MKQQILPVTVLITVKMDSDWQKKLCPDLIILDVMMPKINGYKITALLKYDAKYKNIPILMVTAPSQEEDKLIGEETGADEYIQNRFELDDVVKR